MPLLQASFGLNSAIEAKHGGKHENQEGMARDYVIFNVKAFS